MHAHTANVLQMQCFLKKQQKKPRPKTLDFWIDGVNTHGSTSGRVTQQHQ